MPRRGLLVGYYYYGSPANHYGLASGTRVVAVNGHQTPDMASFIQVIRNEQNRDPVRLKTVTWDGQVEVTTLKLDLRYWPTYEVLHTKDGWARRPIGPGWGINSPP
jgi:C-terminal processing protease CtpA/Prc